MSASVSLSANWAPSIFYFLLNIYLLFKYYSHCSLSLFSVIGYLRIPISRCTTATSVIVGVVKIIKCCNNKVAPKAFKEVPAIPCGFLSPALFNLFAYYHPSRNLPTRWGLNNIRAALPSGRFESWTSYLWGTFRSKIQGN